MLTDYRWSTWYIICNYINYSTKLMRDRIVLWGADKDEKKILISIQLQEQMNQVHINIIPESAVNTELEKKIRKEWIEGQDDILPKEARLIERSLNEEHLLPEDIKTIQTELIRKTEKEWQVYVLTNRLFLATKIEFEALKSEVERLDEYDNAVWNKAKDFSNKIKNYALDSQLRRSQTNEIRSALDKVFDKLKSLQNSAKEAYKDTSTKLSTDFSERIVKILDKSKSANNAKNAFENLKTLQMEFNKTKLLPNDWKRVKKEMNDAFEQIKSLRKNAWDERLGNRVNGLKSAIEKMENSINRDKESADYQNKRKGSSRATQLEEQLRNAKIQLIEERIKSKTVKLDDMKVTLKNLLKKSGSKKPSIHKDNDKVSSENINKEEEIK